MNVCLSTDHIMIVVSIVYWTDNPVFLTFCQKNGSITTSNRRHIQKSAMLMSLIVARNSWFCLTFLGHLLSLLSDTSFYIFARIILKCAALWSRVMELLQAASSIYFFQLCTKHLHLQRNILPCLRCPSFLQEKNYASFSSSHESSHFQLD